MYIHAQDIEGVLCFTAYTSLMAISKGEGIPYDTLTYHFSRNKRTRVTIDGAVIVKTTPISSKRQS